MREKLGIFFFLLLVVVSCRKSDYSLETGDEIYRGGGNGTGTVTWTNERDYLLDGLVFVNDGQVLTIEAGTVIRFRPGQAENASALVVARGGKIIARGTRENPIIFTSENDDLYGSVEKEAKGLWGGLIILGHAPVNVAGGEARVEGIPLFEPRGIFGGDNEADDSGVLRYVSIRHGGTNIGEGNEINGLTLGGVGRKTEIDFVEVISNDDDGVEIFGGTVNLRHLVVSGCSDDLFDYDLGWTGKGQFWLGFENEYIGDHLIEAGGGSDPVLGYPYSLPVILNATLIGNGETGRGTCVFFERFAGGIIANSVFVNNQNGVWLDTQNGENDTYSQWQSGKLKIENNLFHQVPIPLSDPVFQLTGIYTPQMEEAWAGYFEAGNNERGDPAIDPANGQFVPAQKIMGNLYEYPAEWFQKVDFKGAFGEDNWVDGWTLLSP